MKPTTKERFIPPALSFVSISPQITFREARPFSHRPELRPTHLRMADPRADATLGIGDSDAPAVM